MDRKIIVLDDDPTGIQTVHDLLVVTKISLQPIKEAFLQTNNMFYILTNSRSFTEEQTVYFHQNLMKLIHTVAKEVNQDFLIVSRGDSTLRGHYPLETEVIASCLEHEGKQIDGEIICPYLDGIRKTENDIHYVLSDGRTIPCGESEFSKDKTFGYKSSDLKDYVEEKTKGRYLAKNCISISLKELKERNITSVLNKLESVHDFQKVIVNATSMKDLEFFVEVFEKVEEKQFIFRCAASLVKCLGHISTIDFLKKEKCVDISNGSGGIILVGSHVNKTASQLFYLQKHSKDLVWITFDQHRILNKTLHEESIRVTKLVDDVLLEGKIAVVATRRERVDFPMDDPQKQLEWATIISKALIDVIAKIQIRPSFLITKGGITSSDALTDGLHVEKEWVLGQVAPMIGVVKCLEESRFPNLPVVVFPGNVGEEDTLYKIVEILR